MNHINFQPNPQSGVKFSIGFFKNLLKLNYLTILSIISIFTVSAISYSLIQKNRITNAEQELSTLTTEVNKLKQEREFAQNKYSGKLALLNNPIIWEKFLKKIYQAVPKGLQLKRIRSAAIKNRKNKTLKKVLALEGSAASLNHLPVFKQNLSNIKQCKYIELTNITNNQDVFSFKLECHLR